MSGSTVLRLGEGLIIRHREKLAACCKMSRKVVVLSGFLARGKNMRFETWNGRVVEISKKTISSV
jgi:hypothetical protein